MIINGIEITKFRWNDKEVTEDEYIKLCEEHKEFVRKLEESEQEQEKPRKKRK